MSHTLNFNANLITVVGELNSGEIFVECKIQNTTRKCFVDTGSSLTFVALDSFTKSLTRVGSAKKSGASGRSQVGDKVQVTSFRIGDGNLGPKVVGRFKNSRHDLIGMDLFESGSLEFDFTKNKLRFHSESEELPEELERLLGGHLSLPMKFDNSFDLRIIFDTGAGLNSVDQKYVDENSSIFEFIQNIESGYDINGHKVYMKLYKIKYFFIGHVKFENQSFLSFDFGKLRDYLGPKTHFILGFNGLEKTVWKFNLKSKKFSVQKN